jgi:hypothetical protein
VAACTLGAAAPVGLADRKGAAASFGAALAFPVGELARGARRVRRRRVQRGDERAERLDVV